MEMKMSALFQKTAAVWPGCGVQRGSLAPQSLVMLGEHRGSTQKGTLLPWDTQSPKDGRGSGRGTHALVLLLSSPFQVRGGGKPRV